MQTRASLIATLATLSLLLGCSSTPATRFYVIAPVVAPVVALAPAKPAADPVAKPLTLVISDVRLPQYLDRSQIVTRGSDHRLQMSEHEQWGGNLREDMMRVLAENLGRLLADDRVIAAPYHSGLHPDYRIEVEVLRFEREAGGRVRLSARWWLTRVSMNILLASPEASFTGVPLGDSVGYDALVGSMSAVYGELAHAIARSVRPPAAAGS